MTAKETAVVAKNMDGSLPYQVKAREALPILVRQAWAGHTIAYSALADELSMPNPRNLNYPLGSIGQTLIELSQKWGEEIPPIQSLVVNKSNQVPGEGYGWFFEGPIDWKSLSKAQQRRLIEAVNQRAYAYPYWHKVLDELQLRPSSIDLSPLIEKAAQSRSGGEGHDHRELKEWIAANPWIVGAKAVQHVELEHRLPSGDCIDVLVTTREELIGIEVKPKSAPLHDVLRGIFQCVKYEAVLKALALLNSSDTNTRTVLALGGKFPEELAAVRNMLGTTVIEGVTPNHPA